MGKTLVFVGGSASGKTTVINELTRRYSDKFKKVVTCTSRLKRVGEVDGIDYHFFPREYFVNNKNLALLKKTDDDFYYGTRKSDLCSDTHIMLLTLRLTGIKKLIMMGFKNIIIVRTLISDELKIERMKKRGDTDETINIRLRLDANDKLDICLDNFSVIDFDAEQPVSEKIKQILTAC